MNLKKENDEMKEKNQISDFGFVKMPKKLSSERVEKHSSEGGARLSPLSKLIYLFLVYEKSVKTECFTPSYEYMIRTYGISKNNFSEAIIELERLNYIKKDLVEFRNSKRLSISIVQGSFKEKWSAIPLPVVLTDVYTNNQKLFICTVFSLFFYDFKRVMNSVAVTVPDIVKRTSEIGMKKSFVYTAMKELSEADSGFINLFYKDESGVRYYLNLASFSAISNRVIFRSHLKSTKYLKPIKGMYSLIGDDICGYDIVENTSVSNIVKRKKNEKSTAIKEASRLREEAIEKFNHELYKNQHEEINQFIKENGL